MNAAITSHLPLASTSPERSRNTLIFVDASVAECDRLLQGIQANLEVTQIDVNDNGMERITQTLRGREGITTVHIITHGRPGALQLGNTQLSVETIERYSYQLQQWFGTARWDSKRPARSLILHACSVAEGSLAFLHRLQSLTAATIYATAQAYGQGNWQLEAVVQNAVGQPREPYESPFTAEFRANYCHTFPLNPQFDPRQTYAVAGASENVVTADFDEDGDLDLAVVAGSTVSVLKNTGTGSFGAPINFSVAPNSWGIAVGNFNGDSLKDLAVSSNDGTVSILSGNIANLFVSEPSLSTGGSNSRSLIAADVNGDSQTDLVVLNALSNNFSVFLGNGNSTFAAPVTYATNALPYGVDLGDFNQDGKLDLAIAALSGTDDLSIFTNNGSGGFTNTVSYTVGNNSQSVRAADLTGDGKLDLAIASPGNNSITVLSGNGDGTFSASASVSGIADPVKLEIGDFNRDGNLDLVSANRSGEALEVFSISPFGSVGQLPTAGEFRRGVAVGDFDGDGRVDLVSSGNGSSVSVWLNRTLVVTNTNDSGPGSLRQAILDANANLGSQPGLITFAIPGAGPHTIVPTTLLPLLTKPVIIDGYSQSGATPNSLAVGSNAVVKIAIDGTNVNSGLGGFTLTSTASGSTIRGLALYNFQAFGTDAGIYSDLSSNNTIVGNILGTDPDGVAGRSNDRGIWIRGGSNNRVGGVNLGDRNIIVNNSQAGILIDGGTNHQISGNLVGLLSNGETILGNGIGLWVTSGARGTRIGNGIPAGNIISGNFTGITIDGNAEQTWVAGNFIGTNAAGTVAKGNLGDGIRISGNAPSSLIGTNGDELNDGTESNLISGNQGNGINLSNTSDVVIRGNYIGTDAAGAVAIANRLSGIQISNAANNIIGGDRLIDRNLISGNQRHGLALAGSSTTGNLVQGNAIGLGALDEALGNQLDGIEVTGASNNTIGGSNVTQGNRISFNRVGIAIASGRQNLISQNRIVNNNTLGIDLGAAGITPNDPGDSDTGANELQNAPVLTSAFTDSITTTINGSFNGAANTTYFLEFFSSFSRNGANTVEGRDLLGKATITTDPAGNATLAIDLPVNETIEAFVTVTATDGNGNTSEFSNDVTVVAAAPVILSKSTLAIAEGGITDSYTFALKVQPIGDVLVSFNTSFNIDGQLTDGQLKAIPSLTFNETNWNIPQNITITAEDDSLNEGNQTVTLTHSLSSANDFRFEATEVAPVSITITDNDTPGLQFTLPTNGLQLAEGFIPNTATYRLALKTSPAGIIQLQINADGQSELSLDGTSFATSQTLSRSDTKPQTIFVRALNDAQREGNHSSKISTAIVSSSDPNYSTSLPIDSITATILDDETKGIIITPTQGKTQVAETAAVDTYTVALSSQPTSDVTLTINPGTELTTEPATLTFTAKNWNLAQTVTVRAVDDSIVEPSFPFHLGIISHNATSADADYDRLPVVTAAVNITDNDLNVRNKDCLPGQILRGNNRANRLVGTTDSDRLEGLGGNDTLLGGDCADSLMGGKGRDRLIGGAGRDRFIFNQVQEKGDRVVDFEQTDLIDLSGIFNRAAYKSAQPLQNYVRLAKRGRDTLVLVDTTPQTKGFKLSQENILMTLEGVLPAQIKGNNFVV